MDEILLHAHILVSEKGVGFVSLLYHGSEGFCHFPPRLCQHFFVLDLMSFLFQRVMYYGWKDVPSAICGLFCLKNSQGKNNFMDYVLSLFLFYWNKVDFYTEINAGKLLYQHKLFQTSDGTAMSFFLFPFFSSIDFNRKPCKWQREYWPKWEYD